MTVKQMMMSMDSGEYARWMAYERVNGQIGKELWTEEAIASIHEQLQRLAYILSQAHFTNEDEPDGPVEQPSRYPRSHDAPSDDDFDPNASDYSREWLPPPEAQAEDCPPDCICKVKPETT